MHSGRRKLLLADDSPTIRKVISLTFGDEGFEVVAVGDGAEALRALEDAEPPDVLLADVCMPGPDGYELCERVRRDRRLAGLPVVLLVGTFEPFNEAEARRVGADTVLTKPFQSIRDLVSKVGSLLGGSPPREEDGAGAAGTEGARHAAPAEEPARAASGRGAEAPQAEPAFADLAADDELIEARTADAFAAASDFRPAEGARAFVESKDPDFHAEPHAGTNGTAAHASTAPADEPAALAHEPAAPAHEPAAFGANGRGADVLTFEDEESVPGAAAEVFNNQTEESVMQHEQTPPQYSFEAQAAGAAASDDALLDLGQVDTPATASAAEADDFVLDLDFDDEPAPSAAPQSFGSVVHLEPAAETRAAASAPPDAPSAFAEAAHGEQPRQSADAADSFDRPQPSFDEQPLSFGEQPLSFDEQPPAFNEQQFFFDSSAPSPAQAEPAESAEAEGSPWRDVITQDGPQGFAFESEPEAGGGAPRDFVEPEVVPADEPVPATVEGEFTDGSVEGDVPKPPAVQSASPFVSPAPAVHAPAGPELNAAHGAAQHEPSTAGFAVGEARVGVEEPLRADQLSPEAVDAIARRVVELMSDRVVREIAWEVVPELAELLIRRKLEEDRRG